MDVLPITFSSFVLRFQYGQGKLIQIQDESGRTIQYHYEEDLLKAVCHVDEGITTYHYDDNANIIQIIDQNGNAYVTNEYDEKGRIIAQYYLNGTKSTITYDEEKRENTIYLEELDRTERYCYDENYLVTHMYLDDGTCTEYQYDAWTNRIFEQDRKGFETKRSYDIYGNLLEEILPSGQVWEYTYTEQHQLHTKKANTGEEQRFLYNSQGFLIEESEKIGAGLYKQTFYQRDAYGRVLAETDSSSHTTVFEYEEQGEHLLATPIIRKNALSNETKYTYDCMGRQTSITNAYGTVEFRYNEKNAITYIRDGNGNETRRFYDKMGNLTEVLSPNQGRNGRAWSYEYDFFDQLIGGTDPLGNQWRQEKNLEGAITKEISPRGYEEGGKDGYGITYDYDFDNRKIRTQYPDGSVERYFYDPNGNLIKKVRPEYYDAEQDDGKGITYKYDCMNHLIETRDEEGQIQKQWVYNQAGRLEQEIKRIFNRQY